MANEIFHAILIERRDTVVEEEDKEGNDATDKSKQFTGPWIIESIMVKNSIIVEGDVSGEFVREVIVICSFYIFGDLVVVSLSAPRVVLVGVDEFGKGDVFFDWRCDQFSFEVVFDHLVLEVLGENVLVSG